MNGVVAMLDICRASHRWLHNGKIIVALVTTAAVTLPGGISAQVNAAPQITRAASAEHGTRWPDLTPVQRAHLQPLERDWSGIDAPHKQKWLELSSRMPRMSADDRQRIQARMAEWAKLTPEQRGQARLHFREAKQLPVQDRKDRWDAYQSLPAEQKMQLAARASPAASGASTSDANRRTATTNARVDRGAHDMPQPKSNIVPNPAYAIPLKSVSPSLVQARPGATTNLITKLPAPPPHQQTGMPKLAATPDFVNKVTLLPQRGPQAAASRVTPPASGSEASQRK